MRQGAPSRMYVCTSSMERLVIEKGFAQWTHASTTTKLTNINGWMLNGVFVRGDICASDEVKS